MVKWKLQAIEPDTCATGEPSCRYMEWWDADVAPAARTHTLAAFDRVCSAHSTPEILAHIAANEMLGFDGNWKPKAEYIEYQRAWFRRLNFIEWESDPERASKPKPDAIRNMTSDPVTTGSLAVPPQARINAMSAAGNQNRLHNQWKNTAIDAARTQFAGIDLTLITQTWSGTGDARVLTINTAGQLTSQQRTRVQQAVDIAFGAGKIVIQ